MIALLRHKKSLNDLWHNFVSLLEVTFRVLVNFVVLSWCKNLFLSFIHGCCPISKMPKNLSRIGIVFAMVLPQQGNNLSCNHNLNKEGTIKGWVKRSHNKGIFVFNLFRILTQSDPPPHYIDYIKWNPLL